MAGHPKPSHPLPEAPGPVFVSIHPSERSERVLSLGEAATRQGISPAAFDAMIAAGKVESVETGFTRFVPTREVER